MAAVQWCAVVVEVLVEVFGLIWSVDEDIRLGNSYTSEVIGSEFRAIVLRRPVMRQRNPVVVELKERTNQVFVGFRG